MAYQGFGRGLGLKKVLEINKEAVGDMWPDKVIFVDTKIDEALSRAKDQSGDKFESFKKDFFIKVRNGYKIVAKEYPLLVTTVNGNGTIDDVQSKIYLLVKSWIKR